jgi:cyclopropane fatty-acyl-phospholipid synthase-like methyltransferase
MAPNVAKTVWSAVSANGLWCAHEEQVRMTTETAHAAGASPEAIRSHYDVGNDFYRLWLDETMTYSSAMWRDEE